MTPVRRKRPIAASERVHGDVEGSRTSAWDAVYALVRTIPRGRVMTYGQVATLLTSRLSPRAVGWALHGCPGDVPWQRVVNASGRCSTDRLPDIPPGMQRSMLEAEGVGFGPNDALDLERYRWAPRTSANIPVRRVSKKEGITGAGGGGSRKTAPKRARTRRR